MTKTKITVSQAAEQSGIDEGLIRAVIRQTGRENLEDIARHGADAGFHGFVYYTETVPFYRRNRQAILDLAKRMAEDFGQDTITMIAGFNCLKEQTEDGKRELHDEIGRALYGRVTDKETNVANALAWFAAEEVARAMNPDL